MFQAVNYSCASSKHPLFTLLVRMLQMNLFQDLDERGVGGGGGGDAYFRDAVRDIDHFWCP